MIVKKTLEIAGVKVEIRFEPSKDWFIREHFLDGYTRVFSPYFCTKNVGATRYIKIIDEPLPEFILTNGQIFMNIAQVSGMSITTSYQAGIRQFCWVLNQILLEEVVRTGGFFLHCSAVISSKGSLLFLGESGSGKSTIVDMLMEVFEGYIDDQAIVSKVGDEYFLTQLFLPEKNKKIKKNLNKYPISHIYFLNKSSHIYTKKIQSKRKLLRKMASQITASSGVIQASVANLLNFITRDGSYYDLHFSRDKAKLQNFFKQETK